MLILTNYYYFYYEIALSERIVHSQSTSTWNKNFKFRFCATNTYRASFNTFTRQVFVCSLRHFTFFFVFRIKVNLDSWSVVLLYKQVTVSQGACIDFFFVCFSYESKIYLLILLIYFMQRKAFYKINSEKIF